MELVAPIAHPPAVRRLRRPTLLGACMLFAASAAVGAAAIAATGVTSHNVPIALGRAVIVGVPLAVGLYTWCCRPEKRFGLLLAAVGAVLFVANLAESGNEVAYTIGRLAGWLVELLLVYLIVSFPSGRLTETVDRLLVGVMGAVVALLFIPRLLLAETFSVPTPYTSCTSDCPANAFFLLDQEPWIVDAVMLPAGALLVLAVMVAVLVRVRHRIIDATPLARRVLLPVIAIGGVHAALVGFGFISRDIDSTAPSVEVQAWLIAFTVPAIALAFLFGVVTRHLLTGRALERLAENVRTIRGPVTLEHAFAEAFDDPTVQVVFPAEEATAGWVDASGAPTALPVRGDGRAVNEMWSDGHMVGAVIHDEALMADPRAIDAAMAVAAVVVDNQRLTTEAQVARREQRRSGARLAANVERERRKIERDLHDGAQQRLVALRIELGLAEGLVLRDPEQGVLRLRELEVEVDEALDELRSLAHGVYPPLLADRGLPEALRAAGRRSTIPVEIEVHEVGRYPPEVESAVYFCVLEALQNALKHARGARTLTVRLDGGTVTSCGSACATTVPGRRMARSPPALGSRISAIE